jgi:hypothetical protein
MPAARFRGVLDAESTAVLLDELPAGNIPDGRPETQGEADMLQASRERRWPP